MFWQLRIYGLTCDGRRVRHASPASSVRTKHAGNPGKHAAKEHVAPATDTPLKDMRARKTSAARVSDDESSRASGSGEHLYIKKATVGVVCLRLGTFFLGVWNTYFIYACDLVFKAVPDSSIFHLPRDFLLFWQFVKKLCFKNTRRGDSNGWSTPPPQSHRRI